MKTTLTALALVLAGTLSASADTRQDLIDVCTGSGDPSATSAYCTCAGDKFAATLNETDQKILLEITRASVAKRELTDADLAAMAAAHGITAEEYGERVATVSQFASDVDGQCSAPAAPQ